MYLILVIGTAILHEAPRFQHIKTTTYSRCLEKHYYGLHGIDWLVLGAKSRCVLPLVYNPITMVYGTSNYIVTRAYIINPLITGGPHIVQLAVTLPIIHRLEHSCIYLHMHLSNRQVSGYCWYDFLLGWLNPTLFSETIL